MKTNGASGHRSSNFESTAPSPGPALQGKRVGMVVFSPYPADPRPRRAADALLKEGMTVDLICLGDGKAPKRETINGLDIFRIPVTNRRGGKLSYAYQYSAFILISGFILAMRSLRRRYEMVYVHNMPDILVLTALVPKMLGAKVILDLHDPMPELMKTIFGVDENSLSVRFISALEKWSMARADLVLTVNVACKRIFASRSCPPEKIGVVMNAPDETIFPLRPPTTQDQAGDASTKPFVIMYHGSLVERNGLDLAVDALAQLRESVPTAQLRVYGRKTPYLEQVMETARQKGLQDQVQYLGPRRLEDLVGEIENCDVGVVPNQRNAFTEINTPTRIFEYLALGKPVIAPRAAGICDYFDDASLLFFELGSAEDLARQIEYAFSHRAEAAQLAARGQGVFHEHSWPMERARLVGLVAKLLGTGNSRVSATAEAGRSTQSAMSSTS
jgi:glycosyltransferase involved in cell wall biosynthesis